MTRAARAALILLASVWPAGAQTVASDTFRHERTVTVTAPGPQRLDLDAVLLAGTQPVSSVQHLGPMRRMVRQGPPDLRLYTEAGVEVPYVLVPPLQSQRRIVATVMPMAATTTTSGFDMDFREVIPAVTTVDFFGIPTPFVKRFRLEGSCDRVRWTVLIDKGTVFDLTNEQMRQTTPTFAASDVRYLRLTWDDTSSARVGLPTQVMAFGHPTGQATPPLRVPLTFEERRAEPGTRRYRLRLPGGHMPIDAIEVAVGGGEFSRDVHVREARLSSHRRGLLEPVEIGSAQLRRIVLGDRTAESLRAFIQPPTETDLELVIAHGKRPPTDVQSVTAVFAELPWIYFESQPGTLVAHYGSRTAPAPRHDLGTSPPSTVNRATWGEERPSRPETPPDSALSMPSRGTALALRDFTYTRTLPPGPIGPTVVPLDAAAFAHRAATGGEFADVRIVDRDGVQVPYLLEKRDEPMVIDLRLEHREPSPVAKARPGGSEYAVPLPNRELDGMDLVLTTQARVFHRMVRIGVLEGRESGTPAIQLAGSRSWEHHDETTAAPPLKLTVPVAARGEVVVEIDDGDNQPLPIERAALLVPSYVVRFYRRDATPLVLAYGSRDLQYPRYDLSLLEPYLLGQRAQMVEAGPESGGDGGSPAPQQSGARPSDAMFSEPVYWGVLGLSAVVLLGLVVRMMRAA